MLLSVDNGELNLHHRQAPAQAVSRGTLAGAEPNAVGAWLDRPGRRQRAQPAVVIGDTRTDGEPAHAARALELDANVLAGPTGGGVEHVRGDHPSSPISFVRRSRVIFACSSAAVRSSSAGERPSRLRRSSSICSALRPVAHTMKMKPYFCS